MYPGTHKYIIEVKRGVRKFFWHLKHANGRILAHSEEYSSKQRAMKTARGISESLINSRIVDSCS